MYVPEREHRESARNYALRVLKNNIVSLGLEPGSMVSENELAAELGLSRGPVREALIELAEVKIVEIYPQRGSIISPVDYGLVEEACFMRETLEVAVVGRCCRRGIQPGQLDALKENMRLQQFYLDHRNEDRLWELDNEMHRLLFLSAGVMQVYTLMNNMLVHFDRVRAMALTAIKEIRFVEDHRLILDAVFRGDAESAEELMHKHLMRYQIDREAILAKYPQYLK